jgi:Mn-containing catalase
MTDNKTARSTIAYLIVRDQAHENAFHQGPGKPGRGKALPIPKTNAERFPEVTTAGSGSSKRAVHVQRRRPKPGSEAISRCVAAARRNRPEYRGDAAGVSDDHPPERREEFAPGLDKDPSALIQVTAQAEVADAEKAGR